MKIKTLPKKEIKHLLFIYGIFHFTASMEKGNSNF